MLVKVTDLQGEVSMQTVWNQPCSQVSPLMLQQLQQCSDLMQARCVGLIPCRISTWVSAASTSSRVTRRSSRQTALRVRRSTTSRYRSTSPPKTSSEDSTSSSKMEGLGLDCSQAQTSGLPATSACSRRQGHTILPDPATRDQIGSVCPHAQALSDAELPDGWLKARPQNVSESFSSHWRIEACLLLSTGSVLLRVLWPGCVFSGSAGGFATGSNPGSRKDPLPWRKTLGG